MRSQKSDRRRKEAGMHDPNIPELGHMEMPPDFPYREVLQKGKPQHDRLDPFRIRHPRMDPGRRAKIFAPFDALKGFDDVIRETRRKADDP